MNEARIRPLPAARDDLRDTYRRHRPMVERSIAWLIGPKSRSRQLPYRGVTRNNQWLHLRMAALNLRRRCLAMPGE
jgi:hypothetical protein